MHEGDLPRKTAYMTPYRYDLSIHRWGIHQSPGTNLKILGVGSSFGIQLGVAVYTRKPRTPEAEALLAGGQPGLSNSLLKLV